MPVVRRNAEALLFIMFLCAQILASLHFYDAYPGSWSWGELLVNYQGGMTKRGLIGSIAYLLRNEIDPRQFLTGIIAVSYVATTALMLFRFHIAERFSGILFLFSPLGWLFPLLVPAAFGRKDVFVVLVVVTSLAIVSKGRSRVMILLYTSLLFIVGGLIVEIAWLYYPLVLAAYLYRFRIDPVRDRMAAAAVGLGYVAVCLGLTLRIGHVDTAAISASWTPVPLPDNGGSALCCINFDIKSALATSHATLPNLGGYALAEAFGLIPLMLLLAERGRALKDAVGLLVLLAGCVFATIPIFVAADWGRYFYLWTFCTFATAWTVCYPAGAGGAGPGWWRSEPLVKVLFLVVYATTWQTVHYQFVDRSAFVPGIAFRAIGASSIAPFTQ